VEERPTWRYFDRVVERVDGVARLLDIDTGVGNLIADLPRLPPITVGVDAYPPSIERAAPRLHTRGAHLVQTSPGDLRLPFAANSFDLVTSRHPVATSWTEIARVLAPGGRYLSQQVGPHSLRDLSEFLMGPLPPGSNRDPETARRAAEAAGLTVDRLLVEQPRTVFYDVGAVVYFLRLVVWIVPGFAVERYRDRLRALHDHIDRTGSFETTASRFLIEARSGCAPISALSAPSPAALSGG
jgi:SAM-dependent methyltransferase